MTDPLREAALDAATLLEDYISRQISPGYADMAIVARKLRAALDYRSKEVPPNEVDPVLWHLDQVSKYPYTCEWCSGQWRSIHQYQNHFLRVHKDKTSPPSHGRPFYYECTIPDCTLDGHKRK